MAEKIRTTKRNSFFPYVVAVFLATLFYSFELFKDFSEEYSSALSEHSLAKKERSVALNKIKALAVGTVEYDEYKLASYKTNIAWTKFKSVREQEKVLGFKSFHFFMERFGLYFALFCYALYNLFRSFYFERKNVGNKVLHGLIISVCVFYFFWIFQQFQDFPKGVYYIMTFASAYFVVLAVYLITKYQEHYINRLKGKIFTLSKFTMFNTKEDKKDEMFDLLEDVVKD